MSLTPDEEETRLMPKGEAAAPIAASAIADARDASLPPGRRIGPYVVELRLGRGGCATVYLARHFEQGHQVAVKVLHKEWVNSEEMLRRFLFEVTAIKAVVNPGIVEVYDSDVLPDGSPYIAMEYVQGMNLLAFSKLHGRFTPREVLEVLEPVCGALQAAHDVGIIHRDLKASNIMIRVEDTRRVVKLVDFGIAKSLAPPPGTEGITRMGSRVGTPCAMSPEQVRCEAVDQRSDVYALGVLIYGLLVGRYPFDASNPEEVERMHLEDPPPSPSASAPVSTAVDRVVLRCLEKSPAGRFPSVREVIEALRVAVEQKAEDSNAAPVGDLMPAVALYVEARIMPTHEEADVALLDDFASALDMSEQLLREGGMELSMVTGSALLAVKVLPVEENDHAAEYEQALNLAASLYDQLSSRATKDERIHINISIHLDGAVVKAGSRGLEVVGGAITRTSDWAPQNDVQGLYMTPHCERSLPTELTVNYLPYLKRAG